MLYRENPKNGDKLSQLGFGCMRFPRTGGKIDQQKVNEMVAYAIDNGINYFDTAYIYPGSEESVGKAVALTGRRDEIKLATKLPHYFCKSAEDFDKYFDQHLARLRTDRIDYYLLHNMTNPAGLTRLRALGFDEWAAKKREQGKILNLGFSFHGGRIAFKALLDAADWDFCMLQYNYLDENNQAGAAGVIEASGRGMPVFVMEPLRGGMLTNKVPQSAIRVFQKADASRTLADWALRWCLNQSEVTLALSGMSDMEQLTENIKTAGGITPGVLRESEHLAYREAVSAINREIKIPCTSCGYCLPCPMGVDVPTCFSCYNESYSAGFMAGLGQYIKTTGSMSQIQSDASLCVNCNKCTSKCPQGIDIPRELAKVNRRMKTSVLAPFSRLIRKLYKSV